MFLTDICFAALNSSDYSRFFLLYLLNIGPFPETHVKSQDLDVRASRDSNVQRLIDQCTMTAYDIE